MSLQLWFSNGRNVSLKVVVLRFLMYSFHNKKHSTYRNLQYDMCILYLHERGQSDIHCKIKEALLIRDLKPARNENIGSEKLLLY